MKIHHLNCGTCCPPGGRLFDGVSDAAIGHLVCHCLLVESDDGLILIDTGFGMKDVADPDARLARFFRTLNRPQLRASETALRQIEALGFAASDVRHILVTHLDFDHAGGIEDFPQATVHLLAREKEAADARRGGAFVGSRRYRPGQWDAVAKWETYRSGDGDRWHGFDAVRALRGLPPEILLVPLHGHTWGHSGIAIDTPDGWLLHAGDAYFHHGEIGGERYHCPPGLRSYQTLMEVDRDARLANQRRLRALNADHGQDVRIFCAHDVLEFELLSRSGDTA